MDNKKGKANTTEMEEVATVDEQSMGHFRHADKEGKKENRM